MLKDVVSKLDFSNLEEIAIVLFGLSFFMIVFGTLWLRREAVERFSSIPLTDSVVDPRQEQPTQEYHDRKEA